MTQVCRSVWRVPPRQDNRNDLISSASLRSQNRFLAISTRLAAAGADYRNALRRHAEVSQLLQTLGPGNPDATRALRTANREVDRPEILAPASQRPQDKLSGGR
jgi:hypothetical protein